MKTETNIKAEETLLFMALLTFTGGFINAYSFFERGGAFVSFHTGNMVRMGIFMGQQNWAGLASVVTPIMGCLLGVILANLLKAFCSKHPPHTWQMLSLLIQAAVFLFVGFLPQTVSHNGVNWVLSVVTGFQLNNFRLYEGSVHNTTIATGNLRTFGQHLTELMLKRSGIALRKMVQSFLLVFSFPFGALLGTLLCPALGVKAVWLASFTALSCWTILLREKQA